MMCSKFVNDIITKASAETQNFSRPSTLYSLNVNRTILTATEYYITEVSWNVYRMKNSFFWMLVRVKEGWEKEEKNQKNTLTR